MADTLKGCTVAVPAADSFERAELVEPKHARVDAWATVHVISSRLGKILGFQHVDKGDTVDVDASKTLSAQLSKQKAA